MYLMQQQSIKPKRVCGVDRLTRFANALPVIQRWPAITDESGTVDHPTHLQVEAFLKKYGQSVFVVFDSVLESIDGDFYLGELVPENSGVEALNNALAALQQQNMSDFDGLKKADD